MNPNLIKYILLTTVLAGCGGSGGSSNSTASGNSGTAGNSNNPSGPNGSGSNGQPNNPNNPNEPGGSPNVITPQVTHTLDPEFKKFLEANNLKDKSDQFLALQKKYYEKVISYDSDSDTDGTVAKGIATDNDTLKFGKLVAELAPSYITEKTNAFQEETFKEFNIDLDTTIPEWTQIRSFARKLSEYPMSPDLLFSGIVPVFDDNIIAKNKEIDRKMRDHNIIPTLSEIVGRFFTGLDELMNAYKDAINEEVENPEQKIWESESGKLENLWNIFSRSVVFRVNKIVIDEQESIAKNKTVLSQRGKEIFNGLNKVIDGFAAQKKRDEQGVHDIPLDDFWPGHITAVSKSIAVNGEDIPLYLYLDYFAFNASYVKGQLANSKSQASSVDLTRFNDNEFLIISGKENDYKLNSTIKISVEEVITICKDLEKRIVDYLKTVPEFQGLFEPLPTVAAMSAEVPAELSGDVSHRQARIAENGSVNLRGFNVNGAAGESIALGMPLFVQLKGDVSSSKSTEAATGSVAYRLGNTVMGAIQGYANSGEGFGVEGRQLETSIIASHSFGAFFIEGQIGTVSATDVHDSNWKGMRSQVTLGIDTEFVSPFVQLSHRQLDRGGIDLNQTTAYVGVDMDVAKLKADSYTVDTRLLAKVGYGDKAWSKGTNDLGTTSEISGSVEWSGTLSLNSGISFNASLNLDTTSKASASLQFSVEQ